MKGKSEQGTLIVLYNNFICGLFKAFFFFKIVCSEEV